MHISSHIMEQIFGILIALAIMSLCFFVLVRTYWIWYGHHIRRNGFDATDKKPTLFDVRELLLRGEREMAIRVYRQIFKVDQKTAQTAVQSLEKSLHT